MSAKFASDTSRHCMEQRMRWWRDEDEEPAEDGYDRLRAGGRVR